MTTYHYHPDGRRHFIVSGDVLAAAAFLDDPDAPELTEEQFERLTEKMREVREEEEARKKDKGSA